MGGVVSFTYKKYTSQGHHSSYYVVLLLHEEILLGAISDQSLSVTSNMILYIVNIMHHYHNQ